MHILFASLWLSFVFVYTLCESNMCVHHHIPPDSFLTPGARSEALASLLLELHGLQDMLEGLWEWVAGAEATMAPLRPLLLATTWRLSRHNWHNTRSAFSSTLTLPTAACLTAYVEYL